MHSYLTKLVYNMCNACNHVLFPQYARPQKKVKVGNDQQNGNKLIIAVFLLLDEMCVGHLLCLDDDLCGPLQTRLAGIVASLDVNGDGFYDDNVACTWEIRPLKTNIEAIEFFFLTLNMEYSEDCNKDFVKVMICIYCI